MIVWLTVYDSNSDVSIWPVKPTKTTDEYGFISWRIASGVHGDDGPALVCRKYVKKLLKGSGRSMPRKGQLVEIDLRVK